jgi:L-fuculose-phosphate aldolase
VEDALRAAVVDAGARLAARGLVVGTGGNLSVRVDDRVLITPTGMALGALRPEQLTVVDLDGSVLSGEFAPTSELPLHLMVYRSTGATAVAHAHALSSIAVGAVLDVLPAIHYTTLLLGGEVRVAPYATFGSEKLAKSVTAALEGRAAALMRNHGSVAHGSDLEQACDRLELLEWLADAYLRAATLGTPQTLSDADLLDVLTTAKATGYGSTRPAERNPDEQ